MAKSHAVLDTTGEVCPVPLVKTRRSLDKLERGEVLLVIGTHETSKIDIIMATKELGMELVKVETGKDGKWRILIRKK